MADWLHDGVAELRQERFRAKAAPPPIGFCRSPKRRRRNLSGPGTPTENQVALYGGTAFPFGIWFWEIEPGPFRRYVDVNVTPWRCWWGSTDNPHLWFYEDSGNQR